MGKASSLASTDSKLIPQLGLQLYIPCNIYSPHPERDDTSPAI